MSKKETKKPEATGVEHALSASEAFIEKYQKHLLIGVTVIVALVLLVLAVRNFYIKPREIEAENEMYRAQTYFANDNYTQALNGDSVECIGFKEIASEYGMTDSGNLANAYAGICYYNLNDYENAIKYLSQYDGKDKYLKISVVGMTGDCYVQLGQTEKGISYFEKAGGMKNEVLSPIYLKKAGLAYESLNQPEKAEKLYVQVKESYPQSEQASDIDKYIARVQK